MTHDLIPRTDFCHCLGRVPSPDLGIKSESPIHGINNEFDSHYLLIEISCHPILPLNGLSYKM